MFDFFFGPNSVEAAYYKSIEDSYIIIDDIRYKRPQPCNVKPGDTCWYKPYRINNEKNERWFLGYFQSNHYCYVPDGADDCTVIIIDLAGDPNILDIDRISYNRERPA